MQKMHLGSFFIPVWNLLLLIFAREFMFSLRQRLKQ
jgi:hypothetical protein